MLLNICGLACLTQAQSQTFTITGSMSTARYTQATTLLSNGMVLESGGCESSGNCTFSADLYNPATGLFAVTGNMSSKRWGHTSTLLNNGEVLITGGCTGGGTCIATAELYNPATGTFSLTGPMSAARYDHTATALNNGTVLITGGCSSNSNCLTTAELYNPATGTFTRTGSMTSKRWGQAATLLNTGKVLVAGGCTGGGTCLASADLYDPIAGTFAATGAMSVARYAQTATLLGTGKVLVAGGCSGNGTCRATADLYNPATGTFTTTGTMTAVRYSQTATLLQDGVVLITGGCKSESNCLSSAKLYSVATGAFTLTGGMNSRRWDHTATLLSNGNILIAGGCTGGGTCVPSAELYHAPPPVTGFMTPKFIVLSVVYAPPGQQSFVQYGSSTMLGSSSTLDNSIMNSSTLSVTTGFMVKSDGMPPGFTLTTKDTNSQNWTEIEDTSTSVAVMKSQALLFKADGPASSLVGIDHDYDQILVWLNPEVDFTVTSSNSSSYNYSYDPRDPANEVDWIPLTVLDWKALQAGTYASSPDFDPDVVKRLARVWAPNLENGTGPGLTTADYATILARDPFASGSATVDMTRFDLQFGETFPYIPAAPGGQPATTSANVTFQTTSTQGMTATDSYQVGISESTDASFLNFFTTNFTSSSSTTWTAKTTQQYTVGTGQTAAVSVTGPPSGYTGQTDIQVYKDNIYGTFLFVFVN
jgi:hypothetical protein